MTQAGRYDHFVGRGGQLLGLVLEENHLANDAGTIRAHGTALQDALPLPISVCYLPTCTPPRNLP